MRKQLAALVIAGTAVAGLAVAPDAKAADTTTTFTLTGGDLSISAPVSKILSASTLTGTASLSAQLGDVVATDARGALLGQWTATAAATDFTTGLGTADETIADDNVTYDSGLPTNITGTVVPVGTVGAVNVAETANVMTATGALGNNSVTWNPTVAVAIPSDSVAGDYTGTITHSLA